LQYIDSQGIAKIVQSSCVTFSHITPITTLHTALFDLKGGRTGEAGGTGETCGPDWERFIGQE
jgi:hypothetical protein